MRNFFLIFLIILLTGWGGFLLGSFSKERKDNTYEEFTKDYIKLTLRPDAFLFLEDDKTSKRIIVDVKMIDTTIDRSKWLKGLVEFITDKYVRDEDKAKAWMSFLQRALYSSKLSPDLSNGQAVYDPKWLLETGISSCGQTNRILVDGLNLINIKSRLVQLNAHVVSEVFFDDSWHFFDADTMSFGMYIKDEEDRIPSIMQIYNNKSLLRDVFSYHEFQFRKIIKDTISNKICDVKQEYFLNPLVLKFSNNTYDGIDVPYIILKNTPKDEVNNIYFGWNFYKIMPMKEGN